MSQTLSERERRFVDAYMGEAAGNATKAARLAGYSAKSARRIGTRLSSKAHIQEAISSRAVEAGITRDRVLTELALLAFSDLTHYVVDDNGEVALAAGAPDGAMRGLQSIKRRITTRGTGEQREVTREVEIRLWNKPDPLKLAGQHVGLFKDKVEHSGDLVITWQQ